MDSIGRSCCSNSLHHRGTESQRNNRKNSSPCLCASMVKNGEKGKASPRGRLHGERKFYPLGGRASLFATTGSACPLTLSRASLRCKLGQSRIPTAGQINPLPTGRNNCRKVCTP